MSNVEAVAVDLGSGEFDAIYEAELAHVSRVLLRFGVSPSDLEDAVHDVFIILYKKLDQLDRSRPVRPYLKGVAFRIASERRRRAYKRREVLVDEVRESQGATAADAVLNKQRKKILMEALDQLDVDRRAVFVLHDIDEHPMREIAQMLETPMPTLYSRLHTAREQLAAHVRRLQRTRGRG